MNEEYFVHTLLPFARGTQSGDAAIRQSFRKYRDGRNVPLLNMVMDEFKHVVGGVHLPANRVAKMIDANRFHDVLYKIIRGLHFHHSGEILAPRWSLTYLTAPHEKPPDFFIAYAESGRGVSRGKYPSIFAYMFDKFPDVNDVHFWATAHPRRCRLFPHNDHQLRRVRVLPRHCLSQCSVRATDLAFEFRSSVFAGRGLARSLPLPIRLDHRRRNVARIAKRRSAARSRIGAPATARPAVPHGVIWARAGPSSRMIFGRDLLG
jgi:hypothetical protein